MSQFDYVRQYYGVPAKRGARVQCEGASGTVTSATHYVFVRLDGQRHPRPYHPLDLVWTTPARNP